MPHLLLFTNAVVGDAGWKAAEMIVFVTSAALILIKPPPASDSLARVERWSI
jgi:hypothetical protein